MCHQLGRTLKANIASFAFASALLAAISISQAVIVNADSSTATSDPSPYTSAPTSGVLNHGDPGWNNVTYAGDGTAVYLGNGWIITAGHVSAGSTIYYNSTPYSLTSNVVHLTNPVGIAGSPDLKLIQLSSVPALPSLTIRSSAAVGTVVMIGTGNDRSGTLQNYSAGIVGYNWNTSTRVKAWATNSVLANNVAVTSDNVNYTASFVTSFDSLTGEGQASNHDSGSAGFIYSTLTHSWQLAGIIIGINNGSTPSGQPANTAAFGNYTFFADLSVYADQINAAVIPEPASLALLTFGSLALVRRRTH